MDSRKLEEIIADLQSPNISGKDFARMFAEGYAEIHRLAQAMMNRERIDHTLQPTALINEAFMRLEKSGTILLTDSGRFFAIAANTMRQILIDHSRKKKTSKRGGDWKKMGLTKVELFEAAEDTDLMDLGDALDRYSQLDPRACQIVELRTFGDLSMDEIACALGISRRTVQSDWKVALMWLRKDLNS